MDEAYCKKQGDKKVKTNPKCNASEINISDQRIKGERKKRKDELARS